VGEGVDTDPQKTKENILRVRVKVKVWVRAYTRTHKKQKRTD
jgi:hypothetical protein